VLDLGFLSLLNRLCTQVGSEYIHGPVKVEVIWNDEISLAFEGFDVFFVSRHHVIFVAVQHIV
jgi:hypothetical protein